MADQLSNFLDKCRCCLEEITLAKVEIDNNIDFKFFEMTQLNFVASNLLPSYICYECFEILLNYSSYRNKFIESQQRLEQLLLTAENEIAEEEDNVIEYEEVELKEDIDQIIIEESQYEVIEGSEQFSQAASEPEEEEELRLEDIVKPEFLHYCLPKKAPEPVEKVFHIPRQLEKKRHKIEEILKEQMNQEQDYMCQECGKHFPNSVLLQKHINHKHQKYVCDFEDCSKAYSSQTQLNKHILCHRSCFDCLNCGKKFLYKNHLKNHLNTHNT